MGEHPALERDEVLVGKVALAFLGNAAFKVITNTNNTSNNDNDALT